jgi:hypothetical protein
MKRFVLFGCLATVAAGCGPATVRPATYSDPDITCPGGRSAWTLEVLDERVDREGSEKAVAAIVSGVEKSFPGCKWTLGPAKGVDGIVIEIHRFASRLDSDRDGSSWEAAAEWSVRAQNAGGRTLTEFEANEEVSRPNYRSSDNEKESLTQVYQKALERTVKGLRALPSIGAIRPRGETPRTPPDGSSDVAAGG